MKYNFAARFACAIAVGFLALSFMPNMRPYANATTAEAAENNISVSLLTPQGSRNLKTWTSAEIAKLADARGDVSLQKFFDESVQSLDWKNKADVDLLNVFGKKPDELVRLPRFMMVRGQVKLHFYRKSGRVSLDVKKNDDLVLPREALELQSISKIELTQHSLVYPGIQLRVRTNPAASRGEKLFTQNCLGCHSIPGRKALEPTKITSHLITLFPKQHTQYKNLELSGRDARGLEAYRDALSSEKNEIKVEP